MFRRCKPCSTGLIAILLGTLSTASQEFSAEVVDRRSNKAETTRILDVYFSNGSMRVAPRGRVEKNTASVVIVNERTYLLVPDQAMYIESNQFGALFNAGLRLLQPVDPSAPCTAFEEYVKKASCKKVGSEKVNDREAQKWEVTSAQSGRLYLWVDPKLDFVIRMQDQEAVTELSRLREGPQPARLFEIPPGYRKMDVMTKQRPRR